MRLGDLTRRGDSHLPRLAAWARTADCRRKLDQSLRALELWCSKCQRPQVSVSGGKDSTLLLMLARQVDPSILAVRADPPNPLPDRAGHVERLQRAAGGPWRVIRYDWPVEAVLSGDVRYPDRLKIRRLDEAAAQLGSDGIAFGIRAAESKQRTLFLRTNGLVYQRKSGLWMCAPLAWWTANEVVGVLLSRDELPLNPVYRRTHLMRRGGLERLRDGTWWPHTACSQHRRWLGYHYPEVAENYDRAALVHRAGYVDW